MFKIAFVVVSVAVGASLAVPASPVIPTVQTLASTQEALQATTVDKRQEPSAASSNIIAHKKHRPEKIVFVTHRPVIEHEIVVDEHYPEHKHISIAGLLEYAAVPKKYLGILYHYLIHKLHSLDIKQILKGALVAAVVTVFGAVAAVAVAGLVSVVSGICAVYPYLKYFIPAGHHHDEHHAESHLDAVSDFLLGAINKYDVHHKA